MAKFLVHVTCGPNEPTKAALAFFVARAALEEGHTVALFLAGDAVQLYRAAVIDSLQGLGTGSLREHHDALVTGGARFILSGMSAKTRGMSEADWQGRAVELGNPQKLVQLAVEFDKILCY
jgi:predicted peroxiredoxin